MEQTIIAEVLTMGTGTLKTFHFLLEQYKTTGIISRPELIYICDATGTWIAQLRACSERLNYLIDDKGNINNEDSFKEAYQLMKDTCIQVENFSDRLKALCYLRMHRPTPMQEIEQLFNK